MATRLAPNPMADARKVFEILKHGGIAIIPMNVGYGIVAIEAHALRRIFNAKKRKPHKRHAMVGSYSLHREIHSLPPREANIVKLLTVELDLPLGVVAPYRSDHSIIQRMSPDALEESISDNTLAILVNAGKLAEEISRLSSIEGLPLMGSSANLSGKGSKVIVDDIESEILRIADIVIDYGKQKFHYPRASSTMIDFRKLQVLRYGACYDVVQDSLWRFCGIKMPNDPEERAEPSGGTL